MKLLVWLALVVGAVAQDQTQSLGIMATATATATIPITPPSQRPLAACSADSLWRRLRNAEGIDPCALSMNLQRTCTTIDPVVQLTGGESYLGPTSVEAATPCICTTVMYNIIAGCAACQHQLSSKVTRNWVSWSQWSALCQDRSSIMDGVWNRVTLFNSTIPAWAYTKVFQTNYFDLQQAVNIGVSSTAGPTSTSTSSSTPAAATSNTTTTKVGAIVGGALGGVGLILAIITGIFCFLRRRQRRWEEREGVNRPDSVYALGKSAGGGTLQKETTRYDLGGLFSPNRNEFREKPRPVKTETALPDVLADEHQQGKPQFAMPTPMPAYGNNGGGFGQYTAPQSQYTPVSNPGVSGVAGVGAGGRGLSPPNRVTPKDGPSGAAAQMLAADAAIAAKYREGAFREDFSAEGNGYHSSTDADGQSAVFRNGTMRSAYPSSSYPYGIARTGNDNGKVPTIPELYGADRPEDEVHAYSTVGDASVSVYPSSVEHHDNPPAFVPASMPSPIPERDREEYQLPGRGHTGGFRNDSGEPSPPMDSDPFGANRRPAAFSRVFGERPSPTSGNMAGVGTARGSAGNSPTYAGRGGRASISPAHLRRGGGPTQDMGFGRQHQAALGAGHRDSAGISEGSSSTFIGFPGDVGSGREDGSPVPKGPFAGRSGFGVDRGI